MIRIIALIDFSEYSKVLVKFASEFSKVLHCKVIFLHQIPGAVPALSDTESRNQIIAHEKFEAEQVLKDLCKDYFAGNNVDFEVSEKSILEMLNEIKNENYTDWVFTGLKGTGILKKIFAGSTTLKIIEQSDLLSIAFPLEIDVFLPKKLVVAVSYKYPLNEARFENFLSALSENIDQVKFLSILSEDDDESKSIQYLNKLIENFSKYSPIKHLYKGDDVYSEIKKHMVATEDAFLVVQQGSRTLKDSFFRKFMINELVYNASTPLIVFSR